MLCLYQLKKQKSSFRNHFTFPEELIAQVLAQQRWRSDHTGNEEESPAETSELVDLLMYCVTRGGSFDNHSDEGDTSGSPRDCVVG